MQPPLPDLMEELVEEVLVLRLPPEDPGSLVRAALVCELWCRLVRGTSFRRRFREFHRGAVFGTGLYRRRFREFYRSAAPLLSVIHTGNCKLKQDGDTPRSTDTSLKPVRDMPLPMAYHVASDARHGRVVLYRVNIDPWVHMTTIVYSVWDPVTNEQQDLPELPWSPRQDRSVSVVCAATAGGNCDHLDCHRGPFLVLVMEIQFVVHLSIYSSEAGAWSHLPSFELPMPRSLGWCRRPPTVLVGSALYLFLPFYEEIVKYDFATREMSAIPLPSKLRPLRLRILLTDDDGEIGFVVEKDFHYSLLWSTARSQSNMPGKETVTSTATEDDAVPVASRPKRLRRPSTRVTGAMWLV